MADIELAIKIDEEYYSGICNSETVNNYSVLNALDGIRNGTPLPKGHGRMGDLDALKKDMQNYHDDCAKTSEYTRLGFETAMAVVEDAETIIEADTESEDLE